MSQGAKYYFRKTHILAMLGLVSSMTFNIDNINLSGFFIMLLSASTIGNYVLDRKAILIQPKLPIIALAMFYIIYVIGVFYSQNQKEAMFALEKKLSLLLFPLLAMFSPILTQIEILKVLKGFVISCAVVCLVCLTAGVMSYVNQYDSALLYYQSLSGHVGMHAAYLSMYLCFAIFLVLFIQFYLGHKVFQNTALNFFVLGLLTLTVFMLSSRLQIFILAILFIGFVIIQLKLYKNKFKSVLVAALLAIVLTGVVLLFPKNRERFKEAVNYKGEYGLSKKWGEKQMRFLIWGSSTEVIKENLIAGVGTGDVQDELQETYIKNDYISLTYWPNTKFNAHNQYLEITIGIGVIGLLIFLLSVVLIFKTGIKNKNQLLLVFMSIFLLSCFTESMLERQNGIIFYSFFSSFLLVHTIVAKKKEANT